MRKTIYLATLRAAGMTAILACVAGCYEKKEPPAYKTITGTAEQIDENTNKVSMRWYNERRQREEIISGEVTDQTEILINGRVARLNDIRIHETVTVLGRPKNEKDEGAGGYIAARVEVIRDESQTSAPASQPTSTRAAAKQ